MIDKILLRDAAEADIADILEIVNEAILNTTAIYDYDVRSHEAQLAWFQQRKQENMPVIVAEKDGKTVGFGSYGIFRPKIGYRFSVEHSIYISGTCRGGGIGKLLMKELISRAKSDGLHTMIAGIDAENAGSIDFHKQFGFVETGRIREAAYKFDRWLDLVFMQLILEDK
ncbi:phosphinothricin acetyltransferase [Pseudarcicella hirudinis]|uniref:Phosphinothricin acetyltransferase n=1 Tax=Pseudarcicella hirudinis TaxID=1079859 RepID=A0A1I5RMU1_9BACT|nr:GNAT family N-acetyltransferase [Pseudarcicella hirudinis]SFP59216.1 phosphinothricin acetyltransferase [Pseudarcicella hirudinis]